MNSIIENELGTITLDNEAIARIAGIATTECYGIVGMAIKNMKDGIVNLLKMESITKGVRVVVEDKSINIDLHIIVEYGINIEAIGKTIISTVKYKVEEFTSLNVNKVNVFVEGVRVDS